MKLKMDKRLLYIGSGAGLGVVVPSVLRKYDGVLIPQLAQWGKYSTFIPISTGVLSILLSRYKKVKSKTLKSVLFYYGITSTLSGIMYATLFTTGLYQQSGQRYYPQQGLDRNFYRTGGMPSHSQQMTAIKPVYQSYGEYDGWPYVSKARGFGVYTTQNPTIQSSQVIVA